MEHIVNDGQQSALKHASVMLFFRNQQSYVIHVYYMVCIPQSLSCVQYTLYIDCYAKGIRSLPHNKSVPCLLFNTYSLQNQPFFKVSSTSVQKSVYSEDKWSKGWQRRWFSKIPSTQLARFAAFELLGKIQSNHLPSNYFGGREGVKLDSANNKMVTLSGVN